MSNNDVWVSSVDLAAFGFVLEHEIENAKRIVASVLKNIPAERNCPCKDALKHAIMTDNKLIPAKVKKGLDIIIGKYVK